jgi:DNA invertase Pin-like site-specific DNA recombinase
MHAPAIYRDEIDRHCRRAEVVLADVYSDLDYSGWRNSKQRPGLQTLLDNRTSYSAVVIPKLSRFGRSLPDLVRLFEIFDADGIALVFLDLCLDTSTSQGRLLRNMMAAVAEFESDVKSDYLRATHRYIAEQGRPNGGQAAFGYIYDKGLRNYVVGRLAAAASPDPVEQHPGVSEPDADKGSQSSRNKEISHWLDHLTNEEDGA